VAERDLAKDKLSVIKENKEFNEQQLGLTFNIEEDKKKVNKV
jgi:hypothetical protein